LLFFTAKIHAYCGQRKIIAVSSMTNATTKKKNKAVLFIHDDLFEHLEEEKCGEIRILGMRKIFLHAN